MPLTDENAALGKSFIEGARTIFTNAEALYTEATILANNAAWARALFLHQIALEECAKVEMLAAAVTSLLMDHPVDVKPLQRAFARHESKNKTNAYMLPKTEAERAAEDAGDVAAALREFKQLQAAFHKESNTDKNAALYVDFRDGFSSPLQVIDEATFVKVRERCDEYMAMTSAHVRYLERFSENLDSAAAEVAEVMKLLDIEGLERGNSEQFMEFMQTFDEKMRELVRRRLVQRSTDKE